MTGKPKPDPPARMRPPTLRDVAKHAGVSTMTVSRVINGLTPVREVTRERVRTAIEELGYAPNEAARSLAAAAQLRIALLYEKPSAYIAELLFGCLEQSRQHNVQFVVEKNSDRSQLEVDLDRLVGAGTAGILVAPPLGDSDEVLALLERVDKPMVTITSSHAHSRIPTVRIDGYEAAKDMTAHLIALGHTEIAFIAGHPAHAASGIRPAAVA